MESGPDQSNELSMLDGDNGNYVIIIFKIRKIDCTIRVFQSFGA